MRVSDSDAIEAVQRALDKAGASEKAAGLPKGEGSIQGMGESFTPNLSSGTGVAAAWLPQEDRFMYNGGQELVPVANTDATRIDDAPVPAEFAGWQQYRSSPWTRKPPVTPKQVAPRAAQSLH